MAKTVSKRNSEGAVLPGRSKQRKTTDKRETDSGSAHTGQLSDDDLLVEEKRTSTKRVKKNGPKKPKSEVSHRVTHDNEYEVDEGRMESQQFLALVAFETKKKKRATKAAPGFIERYNESLKKSSAALKQRLKDHEVSLNNQHVDFVAAFEEAYASSRPKQPPSQNTERGKEDNSEIYFSTLYDLSQQRIASAKEIIEKFEYANEKTKSINSTALLKNEWTSDSETVKNLLEIGYQVGMDKYRAGLDGKDAPQIEKDDVQYSEVIYGAEQDHMRFYWGNIARKEEKAVKKFLKYQPAPKAD